MRPLVSLLLVSAALAQQPANDAPLVRVSSNEVLLDIVVRDKKGKLVRGLTAADFVVTEDGAAQSVSGFKEIVLSGSVDEGGKGIATPATPNAPAAPVSLDRQVRLVSLVFDRLQPGSRRIARVAGLDLLKDELPPNLYYGVFYADLHLRLVQSYTRDRALLKKAIETATAQNPTDFVNDNVGLQSANQATQGGEGASAAAVNSGGAQVDGGGMANEQMNRMIRDMLEASVTSSREQQGRSAIFTLWAVVRELGQLPGRKTVLYFSEGMQVPNSVTEQFHNMIGAANRANVSIYAVDARGLSVSGDNQLGNEMMSTNARVSQGYYRGSNSSQSEAVSREQVMQFDRGLDAIRANQQLALAELAESTGGFLIANTNDFRQPLRRLSEDLGAYYELSYRAPSAILDGRFHAIQVRVNRPDVKIQSRSGYYALPTLGKQAVVPFEVPLLNALGQKPLPKGVTFATGLLRYRPSADGQQMALVFDMPMESITFRELANKTGYRTHVSVLALLKDEQGNVVEKLSRDVPLEEPLEKLQGFQKGRLIVTRLVKLKPGRYTVEAAAADREGQRVAAKRSVLVVSEGKPQGIKLSSLVLVRRQDAAPLLPEPDDPYLMGKMRVIPTLQGSVPGGEKNALSVYFVLYPEAGLGDKPELQMEILRDGQRMGNSALELPPADATGRIPYIANAPLGGLAPGQYEVAVTAKQGTTSDTQRLFVTIE